jgi:hypothetical protein
MKITRPSGIPAIWEALYLHVALDLSVRRCRTRREACPVLSNWAGATPRTFWAAESRKSGVAPARFRDFVNVTFPFTVFSISFAFRKLLPPQGEELEKIKSEGCIPYLLQASRFVPSVMIEGLVSSMLSTRTAWRIRRNLPSLI